MKRLKQIKWILGCVSVCALVCTAFAQAQYVPYAPQISTSTDQKKSKSQQFCPSKDLVGANVKDAQGNKLGHIREIYVNPKNGEALAAIDIAGRRNAIVPVQALRVSPARGAFRNAEITLNKNKSDVESGPTVMDDDWQKLDAPSFTQTVYSHYNIQAPSAVGGAESPGGEARGGATNQPPIPLIPPIPPQP